jgi:hypothetical protein
MSIYDKLISESGHPEEYSIAVFIDHIFQVTHCLGGVTADGLFFPYINGGSPRVFNKYDIALDVLKVKNLGYHIIDGNENSYDFMWNEKQKNPVKLLWNTHSYSYYRMYCKDDDYDMKIYQVLIYALTCPSDLFYKGKLIIKNLENNGSGDRRGKDECLIDLPHETYIELIDPTLEQFIDALWLIKKHKFDIWYELSGGSKISYENNTLVIIWGHGFGS